MSLEKDYTNIHSFVKKKLIERRVSIFEPSDIISEAFIAFSDSMEKYSLPRFLKLCDGIIFKLMPIFEKTNEHGVSGPDIRYKGGDLKTCKDCKEVFPIDFFRNLRQKYGWRYITIKTSYCRKCQNKRSKKRERIRSAELADSFVIKTILSRKKNKWSKEFILARPRLIEIERRLLAQKRRKRKSR